MDIMFIHGLYMVLTTEGFLERAFESRPQLDSKPRSLAYTDGHITHGYTLFIHSEYKQVS